VFHCTFCNQTPWFVLQLLLRLQFHNTASRATSFLENKANREEGQTELNPLGLGGDPVIAVYVIASSRDIGSLYLFATYI